MRSRAIVNAALLAVPAALLAGALGFQYLGGLAPCEMCLWQRWALLAAFAVAAVAWLARKPRWLLVIAALAVLGNAAIAIFHAGVEQHWWQGLTACTAPPLTGSTADIMGQIMAQPLVRCDAIAWSLWGLSMAAWNALISLALGVWALWTLRRA